MIQHASDQVKLFPIGCRPEIFIQLFCRNEYLARVSESFICLKKMDVIVKPFLLYHTVLYTNMPSAATVQFTDAPYIKAKPP